MGINLYYYIEAFNEKTKKWELVRWTSPYKEKEVLEEWGGLDWRDTLRWRRDSIKGLPSNLSDELSEEIKKVDEEYKKNGGLYMDGVSYKCITLSEMSAIWEDEEKSFREDIAKAYEQKYFSNAILNKLSHLEALVAREKDEEKECNDDDETSADLDLSDLWDEDFPRIIRMDGELSTIYHTAARYLGEKFISEEDIRIIYSFE